jgi:hypothetical protein
VHHPGIVFASLVDKNYRRRADRHQHQKSCRKQQNLPDRAPAARISRHKTHAWLAKSISNLPRGIVAPS